jgi:hypothetical protein
MATGQELKRNFTEGNTQNERKKDSKKDVVI